LKQNGNLDFLTRLVRHFQLRRLLAIARPAPGLARGSHLAAAPVAG